MSRIIEIQKMSVVWDAKDRQSDRCHESVMRAYHILEQTKDFLERGVPPSAILELITEMETRYGEEPL